MAKSNQIVINEIYLVSSSPNFGIGKDDLARLILGEGVPNIFLLNMGVQFGDLARLNMGVLDGVRRGTRGDKCALDAFGFFSNPSSKLSSLCNLPVFFTFPVSNFSLTVLKYQENSRFIQFTWL